VEDPFGDTKSVDDMMSVEVDYVGGFNFKRAEHLLLTLKNNRLLQG